VVPGSGDIIFNSAMADVLVGILIRCRVVGRKWLRPDVFWPPASHRGGTTTVDMETCACWGLSGAIELLPVKPTIGGLFARVEHAAYTTARSTIRLLSGRGPVTARDIPRTDSCLAWRRLPCRWAEEKCDKKGGG
jgi:hypothetical protein